MGSLLLNPIPTVMLPLAYDCICLNSTLSLPQSNDREDSGEMKVSRVWEKEINLPHIRFIVI